MKKLLSLILVLSLLILSASTLISCSLLQIAGDGTSDNNSTNKNDGEDNKDDVEDDKDDIEDDKDDDNEDDIKDPVYDENGIIKPPSMDYLHAKGSLSDVKYERPDVEKFASELYEVAKKIEDGIAFNLAVSLINTIEYGYVTVNTMYSLAELESMKDSTDEFWAEEYAYLSSAMPNYSRALEELFVACATSDDRERFENEYFMYSLEEYADGGDYTDELVRLESLEGELIAEYVSLSPDNTKRANEIYVELLRVRKKIANELGLESYIDRAYEMRGHDHTADEVHAMILNIGKYVLPVYFALYDELFDDYFSTAMPSNVEKAELLNNLYLLFDDTDENLAEAYSFMLECGLYDIEDYSDKRYEGAFTTYIFGIDAPYIFMTSWGDVGDYLTLTHEFGHFFDSYANFGQGASLSLGEISSQALELMTVPRLDGIISEEDLLFLSYYQLYLALDTLLYQGFIALFEHYVYALEYEDINLTTVERLLNKAQLDMFGGNVGLGQLESVIMQHTVAYPFYVESYCTSLFASLDIFLTDIVNEGDGLEIYLDLILGGDPNDKTFKSELERVGLDTPFTESYVMSISDEIYYYLTGIHFYTNESQAA